MLLSLLACATPSATPPDGKYEHVTVDGVVVPMVHVMDGGTVLLVDTDGIKPRTWEEQYKRGDGAPGTFTLHKTDANDDERFDDERVDREGRWVLDAAANLSRQ